VTLSDSLLEDSLTVDEELRLVRLEGEGSEVGEGPIGGKLIEGRRDVVELVSREVVVGSIGGRVIDPAEDELDSDSLEGGGFGGRGEEVVNREVEEREL